jgi:hypothetical protein
MWSPWQGKYLTTSEFAASFSMPHGFVEEINHLTRLCTSQMNSSSDVRLEMCPVVYDVIAIGGGIARELTRFRLAVVLRDKEAAVGSA